MLRGVRRERAKRRLEAEERADRDGWGSGRGADLSGGRKGIVVMPTPQTMAPIGPEDMPEGIPDREAAEHVARICAEVADTSAPVHVEGADRSLPYPPPMAMVITVSPGDRAWVDRVRRASYELSVRRGHMRR